MSISSCMLAASEAKPVDWNNLPTHPLANGVTHHELESKSMQRTVGYTLYLPEEYAAHPEKHYPVIYFLHGYGGDENADGPGFSGIVAGAIRNGLIPPVICVFPNGGKSFYRDHPDTGILVESMLISELIPAIDAHYRTIPDRDHRVISGFSMGGAGALRLAVLYPELFSAAGSWAGAIGDPWDVEFPSELTEALLDQIDPKPRLLMICGTEDEPGYPVHLDFIQKLYSTKYDFTYHALRGVPHKLGLYYSMTGREMVNFLCAPWIVE